MKKIFFLRIILLTTLLATSFNVAKSQSSDITSEDIKFESGGITLAGTIWGLANIFYKTPSKNKSVRKYKIYPL